MGAEWHGCGLKVRRATCVDLVLPAQPATRWADMTRHSSQTSSLLQELSELDTGQEAAAREVAYALGAADPASLHHGEFPVLGYWISASAQHFLCYLVTPGRFLRVESLNQETLTIAVPLTRVSRLVEARTRTSMSLEIEMDADAVTTMTESQDVLGPDGARGARGVTRATRTVYTLLVDGEGEPADVSTIRMTRLWQFARILRSSIGA